MESVELIILFVLIWIASGVSAIAIKLDAFLKTRSEEDDEDEKGSN